MKSDHWFYGFFRECPATFFRLMGRPPERAADYRYDAVELKAVSLRLDGIFCPLQAGGGYFFLEAQLYKDADFYRKWMAKILLYTLQYRVEDDWHGLVLFGSQAQEPSHPPGLDEWLASGRIQRVYLNELPDYPDASLDVAVLKLAVTKPEQLVDRARDLASAVKTAQPGLTDPKKLLGIIEAFLVSNFPRMTREEIQTMLQLNDIRESTIFQEGLQEGKLEGLQEGKLAEQLEIIARLHAKGRSVAEICEWLDVDESLVRKALTPRQPEG